MCGRYASSRRPEDLVDEFDIVESRIHDALEADYNVAPTKEVYAVVERPPSKDSPEPPERQLRVLTWGLIPSWAKEASIGNRMINARMETVAEKPAYKRAFAKRRCLLPADGYFEWYPTQELTPSGKPRKQPFFTTRVDGASVAMAGLYEFWRDPTVADPDDPSAWLATFTVVTGPAEPGLDRIHDRQPVVLEAEEWATWLDPGTGAADVLGLLEPHRPGRFTAYPVSRAVSSNRSNGPQLLEPLPADELVGVVDPQTGEVIGGNG